MYSVHWLQYKSLSNTIKKDVPQNKCQYPSEKNNILLLDNQIISQGSEDVAQYFVIKSFGKILDVWHLTFL